MNENSEKNENVVAALDTVSIVAYNQRIVRFYVRKEGERSE